jgi:hypothetical protein
MALYTPLYGYTAGKYIFTVRIINLNITYEVFLVFFMFYMQSYFISLNPI